MIKPVKIMPCLDMQNGRVVKGVHFVDIADAGDGQPVGGLGDLTLGDEIVVPVQGVLENFLFDVLTVGSACKEELHILL